MFFLSFKRKKARAGAKKFLEKPIKDLMTPYVVTTRPDASVVQAATRMVAQNISCIVVTNIDNPLKVKGIITERDFIKGVPANTTALKKKVSDIMTNKITAIAPEETVAQAIALMQKHGFRKLVVEEDGKLVGILTQTDIVSHALKSMKNFQAEKPLVQDWMTKNIISVKPKSSFADAKKLMVKKDIGAVLVKGQKYEGIFTEYDVVAQFYDQGGVLHIGSPKEIMHEQIRSICSHSSIMFANRVMVEKKVRRLLVVEKGNAVGIITQTDILRALAQAAENLQNEKFLAKQETFYNVLKDSITTQYVTDNFKVYEK